MKLGIQIDLIVLDGDPAPPNPKMGTPPVFDPCLLWPNGSIDQYGKLAWR